MGQQLLSRVALGAFYFLRIISIVLYARFILSWFMDPFNRFFQIIVMLTEPFVSPIRNLMQRLMGGQMRLDFSVMIAGFVITLIQRLLYGFM